MRKYLFSLRFFLLLLVIVAIVFTYWDLYKIFYQQDEWLGLGQIIALGYGSVTNGFNFIQVIFGDPRPLTRILGVVFFGSFPFQSIPLALYGIILHIANTLLVFLIAKKILKKDIPAIISAAFFGLSSVSQQSITWFAASFGVQPASFCIFFSIYLFLLFIEKRERKFSYPSLFFALLSIYFKESGIFLFIFLPLLPFILGKRIEKREYFKLFLPIIIFILLFVFYRLFEMTIEQFGPASLIKAPVYANVAQGKTLFVEVLLSRTIMYPLTSFSLSYLPVHFAINAAMVFTRIYYPFISEKIDLISETVVLDLISSVLSLIILFFCYFEAKKTIVSNQIILFSLSLFTLSILPYIVIGKSFAYLEPRYYYIPLIASSILLGFLAKKVLSLKRKYISIKMLFIFVFCFTLFLHISETKQAIQDQVQIANIRRNFLQQLHKKLPKLVSNTNVMYFTGNKIWWDENNRIPFQHGFGYSIPVLYYNTGKVSKSLLVQGYFWSLGSEGYKKNDGLAYGYYSSFNHLKQGMDKYHFSPENVHAYYYDSQTEELKDISIEIRQRLAFTRVL